METSPKKKTLRAELIRLRRDAEQIEDRAVAEINLLDRAQQGDDKAYRELVDQINRRAETRLIPVFHRIDQVEAELAGPQGRRAPAGM